MRDLRAVTSKEPALTSGRQQAHGCPFPLPSPLQAGTSALAQPSAESLFLTPHTCPGPAGLEGVSELVPQAAGTLVRAGRYLQRRAPCSGPRGSCRCRKEQQEVTPLQPKAQPVLLFVIFFYLNNLNYKRLRTLRKGHLAPTWTLQMFAFSRFLHWDMPLPPLLGLHAPSPGPSCFHPGPSGQV